MAIIHQPELATLSSTIYSHIHVKYIKQLLAYPQDLFPALVGVFSFYFIPAKVGIYFCIYARECFTYLYMHLATYI